MGAIFSLAPPSEWSETRVAGEDVVGTVVFAASDSVVLGVVDVVIDGVADVVLEDDDDDTVHELLKSVNVALLRLVSVDVMGTCRTL